MARLLIPSTLLRFTENRRDLQVGGETVGQVLDSLAHRYPELGARIYDERGGVRSSVHVFVGERDIGLLRGPETPVRDDTVIRLIPAIAGG